MEIKATFIIDEQALASALAEAAGNSARYQMILQQITNILNRTGAMAIDLSQLQAAVSRDTTVTESLVTLVTGLGNQLKDALAAAGSQAETQAAIDSFVAQFNANTNSMAAAVAANTPAQPEQPQPEPTSVDPAPVDPTPTDPPIVDPVPTDPDQPQG